MKRIIFKHTYIIQLAECIKKLEKKNGVNQVKSVYT